MDDGWRTTLEFLGVAAAGGGIGLGEIVSRYRDQPLSAVWTWPGGLYIVINAAASIGALAAIRAFGWQFGQTGSGVRPVQLLVAGFGAMGIFRSSLFTIRAGSHDVGIGPSSLLSILLDACDRAVDRERADRRAREVVTIMRDVSYDAAHDSLPTVALALMQNLPPGDQSAVGIQLEKLHDDQDIGDQPKSLLLGLALMNVVGGAVLRAAKEALGRDILRAPEERADDAIPPDVDEELRKMPDPPSARAEGLPQTPQTP